AAGSFIAMLYLTGARKSEVLLAKWEHVNWEDKTLFVPQGESVNILLNFTQFFETRIEYRFQIFTAHSCD
ncbi:hypothetical protein UXH10_21255, partial [Aeromonas caviae]|nr:hypothetical protein [Aeromonas caviae]